jgi:hypothetical protein
MEDGNGEWKAWTAFTQLEDIVGFEQIKKGADVKLHGTGKNWGERCREEQDFEKLPATCLIGTFPPVVTRSDATAFELTHFPTAAGARRTGLAPGLTLHTSSSYNQRKLLLLLLRASSI